MDYTELIKAVEKLQQPEWFVYVQIGILIAQVFVTGFFSWKLIQVTQYIAEEQISFQNKSALKDNILKGKNIIEFYKNSIKKDFGESTLYKKHETYVLYDEIVDYFFEKYGDSGVDISFLNIALQELAPGENIKTHKFDFRRIVRFG